MAQRVLQLCARSLVGGDNEQLFSPLITCHTSNLVCGFHAPHVSAGTDIEAAPLVNPHSDTGLLTFISYPDEGIGLGGLELKDRDTGGWVPISRADWPPGAILVNMGDSMCRLSNGRLRSTPHRVMSTVPKVRVAFLHDHPCDVLAFMAIVYISTNEVNARLVECYRNGAGRSNEV